jgi:cytochrome c oxidase subunit 4
MTLVLIWMALVLLLGMEVLSAVLHAGWVAFGLAPIMVAVVTVGYMHVLEASPLARIFATAGMFWLLILVGLGGVDFFARNDVPAPVLTRSGTSAGGFAGSDEPGYDLPQSHFTAPQPRQAP